MAEEREGKNPVQSAERRKEEKAERSAIALRSDGAAARCERTVRLFGKTDAESDAEPL